MFNKYYLIFALLISSSVMAQTISTVTNGAFSDALALDSQGNLYGSDWSGNTVYKYDPNTGVVTTFKDGFLNPNGIGINSSDEIYVCDHTRNRIYKYDTDGNELQVFLGSFVTPAGIKKMPNTEDMLVVEYGGGSYQSRIKMLSATGTVTTLYQGAPLNGPAGIAFVDDIPYIANFNDRKIFRFQDGTLTEITQLPSEGPPTRNFLGFLSSIDGHLIATHIGGHKVYKIDVATGETTVFAGSSMGNVDGDISSATLDSPNGIVGDESNSRIYVSQGSLTAGNRNLRVIDGVTLSVETLELPGVSVSVFPNPSKDSLNIQLNGLHQSEVLLTIYDLTGKEVLKKKFENVGSQLEEIVTTKDWGQGVYFLKIGNQNQVITKKIVID